MFAGRAFQCWYGWHAGWRRVAVQCLLACALLVSTRSASALEEPDAAPLDLDAPFCDPDAVASGNQLECARPAPPPVVPPAAEAPMCDETGASIAARIVIPELDRGRLEALPCELVLALFGSKKWDFPHASPRWANHRPPAEPTELTLARADAALPQPLLIPGQTESRTLLEPLRAGLDASPGHLRPPYRPPLG